MVKSSATSTPERHSWLAQISELSAQFTTTSLPPPQAFPSPFIRRAVVRLTLSRQRRLTPTVPFKRLLPNLSTDRFPSVSPTLVSHGEVPCRRCRRRWFVKLAGVAARSWKRPVVLGAANRRRLFDYG